MAAVVATHIAEKMAGDIDAMVAVLTPNTSAGAKEEGATASAARVEAKNK